jgi:hypothetical protein
VRGRRRSSLRSVPGVESAASQCEGGLPPGTEGGRRELDPWPGRTLSQALVALPYYRKTNPVMARNARHVIRTVLGEG